MSYKGAHFPNASSPQAREQVQEDGASTNLVRHPGDITEAPVDRRFLTRSDEGLLKRVRQDDKDALAELFGRYARTVRNVAYRILRDSAEADDLVQDVFLFVLRKAALFDPNRGSARSWLVQVAYHRAFDRRRYLATRGLYAQCQLDEETFEREEPTAPTFPLDRSMEASLGEEILHRIEASLTEVQRRVLELRFSDGHTMEEIAVILGQSAGNIRNHYYRALDKMRKEISTGRLQARYGTPVSCGLS